MAQAEHLGVLHRRTVCPAAVEMASSKVKTVFRRSLSRQQTGAHKALGTCVSRLRFKVSSYILTQATKRSLAAEMPDSNRPPIMIRPIDALDTMISSGNRISLRPSTTKRSSSCLRQQHHPLQIENAKMLCIYLYALSCCIVQSVPFIPTHLLEKISVPPAGHTNH